MESVSGRVLRLFQTGHQQESRIVADFRRAGFSVWDLDPETGKQFKYMHESGHFVVKIDGVIKTDGIPSMGKKPHVLEVKTHNDSSFKDLLKKLSVAKSKPEHYLQMQAGMHLSKMDRALYVALNKNDENYYIERVPKDPAAVAKIEKKIKTLLYATLTPAGISETQSAFGCKFCPFKGSSSTPNVCAGETSPLKHCRTCSRSQPVENGDWVCSLLDITLTQDAQQKGCEHHNPRSIYF